MTAGTILGDSEDGNEEEIIRKNSITTAGVGDDTYIWVLTF